jgi:YVTN family beta-propeller protein
MAKKIAADAAIAINSAFPFDTAQNTAGSDITLSSPTFTLKAGHTYQLQSSLSMSDTAATSSYQWRDTTNGVFFGTAAVNNSVDAASGSADQQIAMGIITPTTDITVELWNTSSGARTFTSANSYAYINEIAGNSPVIGSSVDYVKANKTTSQFATNGASVLFDTVEAGNISYAPGTGNFTLTAGKTYLLTSSLAHDGSTTTGSILYQWYRNDNNTALGSAGGTQAPSYTNDYGSNNTAQAVFTPSSNLSVSLRVTGSFNGNIQGGSNSFATIQQLGSSALTQDSVVAVGGNAIGSTVSGFSIGSLTQNALAFITNGIQRLFIATSTTNVGIGTQNVSGSVLTVATTSTTTSVFALTQGDNTANFFIASGTPVGIASTATGSLAIDTASGRLYIASGAGALNWTAVGASTATGSAFTVQLTDGNGNLVSANTLTYSTTTGVLANTGTTTLATTTIAAGSANLSDATITNATLTNTVAGNLSAGTTTLGTTTISTSSISFLNVLNTLWANTLSFLNITGTNATITNATTSNLATGNITATGTTALATTTIAAGSANLSDATITNATLTNTVAGNLSAGTTTLGTTTISTSSISNLNVLATLWANILSVLNLDAVNATLTNATSTNLAVSGTTSLATTTASNLSSTGAITLNSSIVNGTTIGNVLVIQSATGTANVLATTSALYNINGQLYFNGQSLATGGASAFVDTTTGLVRLSTTTNAVLIGAIATTTNSALEVNGTTTILGVGTTSNTIALVVKNASGSNTLQVRDDGTFIFGNQASTTGTSTIWGSLSGRAALTILGTSTLSTTTASYLLAGNTLGASTTAIMNLMNSTGNSQVFLTQGTPLGNLVSNSTGSLAIDTLLGKLYISAGSATSTQWQAVGTGAGSASATGTAGAVQFADGTSLGATSTFVVSTSTGQIRLGLGTSTPDQTLSVVGNISNLVDANSVATITGNVTVGTNPRAIASLGKISVVVNNGSNNVSIVDTTNATAPSLLGSVAVGVQPTAVALTAKYAYVTNQGANSISVIDISNPSAPTVVSTASSLLGSNPAGIALSGRYLYVTNVGNDMLTVFDAQNPTAVIEIGSVAVGTAPIGIAIQGKYAYIANSNQGTMSVVDISVPTAPVQLGTVIIGTNPSRVAVSGRYAYVTNAGDDTFSIVDVSVPATPVEVGTGPTGQSPLGISISGRYAIVANQTANSVTITDVTNPASGKLVKTIPVTGTPIAVSVVGRYANVAGFTGNRVSVIDLGGTETNTLTAGSIDTGSINANIMSVLGNIFAGNSIFAGLGGIVTEGSILGRALGISGQGTFGTSTVATTSTLSSSTF